MIIAFAGPPGSGKTTLSKELADQLGIPRVGFGSYVKTIATSLNLATDRKTLQSVGQAAIEKGVNAFCNDFLAVNNLTFDKQFIIDGVRHLEVLSYLRSRSRVLLVYVTVPAETLKLRLQARNELELFSSLQSEPTEREVEAVLSHQADLLVRGDRPQSEQVLDIVRILR